jgi:choline monooxygenase
MSSYTSKTFDRFSLQSAEVSPEMDITDKRMDERGASYIFGYPNWLMSVYGKMMDVNIIIPITQTKCVVRYFYYFREGESEEFIKENLEFSDLIQNEDSQVCIDVQNGYNSCSYVNGIYSPSLEILNYHFHQLYHNDINKYFL